MKHTFEITEKYEVTFPHFRKYSFFYYKIINESKSINVMIYPAEDRASIELNDIVKANVFMKGSVEITEEEFNIAMAKAYQVIINNNN